MIYILYVLFFIVIFKLITENHIKRDRFKVRTFIDKHLYVKIGIIKKSH